MIGEVSNPQAGLELVGESMCEVSVPAKSVPFSFGIEQAFAFLLCIAVVDQRLWRPGEGGILVVAVGALVENLPHTQSEPTIFFEVLGKRSEVASAISPVLIRLYGPRPRGIGTSRGEQRGPGRHAQCHLDVSLFEDDSLPCQALHVWGVHVRAALIVDGQLWPQVIHGDHQNRSALLLSYSGRLFVDGGSATIQNYSAAQQERQSVPFISRGARSAQP